MSNEDDEPSPQFETFRDCLSAVIVEKLTKKSSSQKSKRRTKKHGPKKLISTTQSTSTSSSSSITPSETSENDAETLADFADYIATEIFESFPEDLKSLTHQSWIDSPDLQTRYALPLTGSDIPALFPTLDPSISESLIAYGIIDGLTQGVPELLAPVLCEYISAQTAAPPPPRSTRADVEGCEICGRDWIPLSYHHLIPRFVHDKAVKRGWHRAEDLQNVAWICGLCHRFVHRFASHETLARHYYTVDLLLEEEEVVKFAKYASRVRWKGK